MVDPIHNLCIFNALDGLQDGLSHFSGASRVALVYAIQPNEPMRIYDPQNLLRGHEPKLKELYLDAPHPGGRHAAPAPVTHGNPFLDEMNRTLGWDSTLRVYGILDAVLGISRTPEEGTWPRGNLVCAESQALATVPFMARFPESERPVLNNFKHVRKLLQAVENSPRKLVSDGRYIVGIADHDLPDYRITADFRGGHGFLRYKGEPVCSFEDGPFHSTTHLANLVQVEEILIDTDLAPDVSHDLYRLVTHIVHLAEIQKYGCTLVVDLNSRPIEIPGQKLERTLDLRQAPYLELASALAKLDGALHIGADLKLHGFGCLLDGLSIPGEDRSRGARFNSALRFTAERPDLLVIVVSADRPVAIIQAGVELSAQCDLKPLPGAAGPPPTLASWIESA